MKTFIQYVNESQLPPNAFWVDMEDSSILDNLQDSLPGLKVLCVIKRKINRRLNELVIQMFFNGECIGGGTYTVDMEEGTADDYRLVANQFVSPQGAAAWAKVKSLFKTRYSEIGGKFIS